MDIAKTQEGDKTIFGLVGQIDTRTAPELQETLIPEFDTAKEIMLDLSEVTYVSSAGLRILLLGEKTAKAKSCLMTLTGVSEEVMEVFEMTGFDEILHIA